MTSTLLALLAGIAVGVTYARRSRSGDADLVIPTRSPGHEASREAAQAADIGFLEVTGTGSVTWANDAAYHIFGCAAGSLVGRPASDLGWAHGTAHEHARYLRPDGAERILDVRAVPARADGSGAVRAYWVRDDTKGVRDTATIEALERRLQQTARLETLGTVAGAIAHDLNNVLTPIRGHVDLARLELVELGVPTESSVHEDLDLVVAASDRAAELTRRLVHLGRPDREERRAVQMVDVAREAVGLLRPTLEPGVEIRERMDPNVPPVLGSATQLHQVVLNLAKNAVHALEAAGRLTVEVTRAEVAAPWETAPRRAGPWVRVRIEDNGVGMDEATLQRIYDPFFTTKSADDGSGLGLAMVRTIVRGLDGTICVSSEAGRGTVFSLLFPPAPGPTSSDSQCEAPPRAEVGRDLLRPPNRPAVASDGVPGAGSQDRERKTVVDRAAATARVLLVDDDATVLDVYARSLERLGHHVTAVSHGEEALACFLSDPSAYDLLLTDQMMPGLSGLELVARARATRPDIPAVITTGRVDALPEGELDRLDCALLPKPASALDIDAVVSRCLEPIGVPTD